MRSTYPSHNIHSNEVHQKNLELHSSMHIADEDAIMDEVEQSKLVLSYTLQHFHAQTQSHFAVSPTPRSTSHYFAHIDATDSRQRGKKQRCWQLGFAKAYCTCYTMVRLQTLQFVVHVRKVYNYFCISYFFII